MPNKLIIPTTPSDFQSIEDRIVYNNDSICLFCDRELEKYTLSDGVIIYLCYKCGTIWEKEMLDENNFRLIKSNELTMV